MVDATDQKRDVLPALFALVVLIFGVPSVLVFQPLGAGATPAALLGTALFLWWACTRLLGQAPDMPGIPRPLHFALGLFVTACVVSYVLANMHPRAALEVRSADRALLLLLAWCGIALAVADGVRTRHSLERLLRALVLGGAIMASIGMLQFFFGFDIARYVDFPGLTARSDLSFIQQRSIFRRVAGTAGHPIEFGVTLAIILPLAVHFVVAPGVGRRRRDVVYLVLIAASLPMCVSRSATLGGIVAGAVLFAGWSWEQRRKALLIVPIFAVIMRLLIPGLLGTIRSLFTNLDSDPSIQGRTNDYAFVSHYIDDSPLFGRGWGTFVPEMYTTLDNQYLGQIVETGFLGLAALLGIFLVGILCARGARRRSPDEETRHLGQALAASVAVAMVTFLTFDGLSFPMVTSVTFLILGSCAALWRMQVETYGFVVPSRWSARPAVHHADRTTHERALAE